MSTAFNYWLKMSGVQDFKSLVIRHATEKSDWEELCRLCNEQNWNDTVSDYEVYFACDPKGVFVAILDGKPVGFTASVIWSDEIAVGGLSVVNKEYRGNGIGKALWAERRKHIGDRGLLLFSIQNRIEANMKLGFKPICPLHLMSGRVKKATLATPGDNGYKTVPYDECRFDQVLDYDNLIHHIKPRGKFLKLWFGKEKAKTLIAISGDKVVGFGCIYPTFEGYKIGPLYADNFDICLSLLKGLLESVPEDEPMITMSVFNDEDGLKLAKDLLNLSIRSPNETAMCTKEIHFNRERVYAVVGLSLTFT